MLHTLVLGMGRAGAGLHLSVLPRLRKLASTRHLFAEAPIVVCDPRLLSRSSSDAGHPTGPRADGNPRGTRSTGGIGATGGIEPTGATEPTGGIGPTEDIVLIDSIGQAAGQLDPERTVTHICTPPTVRLEIIEQLAVHGFRKILVEKPLALDEHTLERIEQTRRRYGLCLIVVAQWLVSELTLRLQGLMHSTVLGELRSLSFLQRKPRFSRSLRTHGHPTAFDVELPHSVGVALRLAGAAQLADAECTDMVVGDTILPWLGGARLTLQHHCGVHTEIISDLTSPVRERRVVLQFERGLAIGHYPGSQDDDHAQLSIVTDGESRSVFRDDALTIFLLRAYQRFHTSESDDDDFALNAAGVRLLCAAKQLRALREATLRP